MSAIRLLPLLLAMIVLSVCLPSSVVGQDPTVGCYTPVGDPTTGVRGSDSGYYNIIGLESYTSTGYNILCAYRALYNNGPNGAVNTYGPWRGNNKLNLNDCTNHYVSNFDRATDWALAGTGSVAYRANNATGTNVMVAFSLGGVCSSNYICAGVCPGTANYAASMATLQADPTYQIHQFTTSASGGPAGTVQVISMLNATSSTNTSIKAQHSDVYPTKVISVVTSVAPCYGYKTVTC